MGTTTTNFNLYKPDVGETGWGALVNANFNTIDTNLGSTNLKGQLFGCQLSNNAGTPTLKIDISAGQAQDAAGGGLMTLAAAITKNISSAWVVGNDQGGLGTGVTLTTNQTYHVYVIKRTDTAVVDAYFDTSTSAANIPANYTLFRRVGSVLTLTTGATIRQFTQDGDYWRWTTTINVATTLTNVAVSLSLIVPTGFNLQALFHAVLVQGTTTNPYYLLSDLAATDVAVGSTSTNLHSVNGGDAISAALMQIRTNTSGQIRGRSNTAVADGSINITTIGYFDTRGRDS